MIEKQTLRNFLVEAKKATYASGENANKTIEDDSSTSLIYQNGDLKYHDNYFGGEPFGGREVVFLKDKPVYIMTYYGLVDDSFSDILKVYKVLQSALSLIPLDYPFRGPKEHSENGFKYNNDYTGDLDNFSGEETITSPDGKEVYKAKYAGGFVCQRQ